MTINKTLLLNGVFGVAFVALTVFLVVGVSSYKPVATISAAVDDTRSDIYVAMGDSVAAGVGAGASTEDESGKCGRTDGAFSEKVARDLRLDLTNISCGGATIPVGITGLQPSDTDTQLNKLFSGSKPGVISITIGANDLQWIYESGICLAQPCGTPSDKKAFNDKAAKFENSLRSLIDQIHQMYLSNKPEIYVTGYYQIASTSSDEELIKKTGKSIENIAWIEEMRRILNETIRRATLGYGNVRYVDIDFSGHEFYTQDPWVRHVTEAESLHPNIRGEEEMAKAVIKAINLHRYSVKTR